MSLFGKKNKAVAAGGTARLFGKVSANLGRQQLRFASYLNTRTAQLSDKGKIIFLVLICLLFGGMSLYFLINAFH